jgi:catechol 2,3-dioxygenase-like lactoylglutathione lyase family enzyme
MFRPALSADPSQGLLVSAHFQIAYTTNDIDRALALFSDRYGVREWQRLEGPLKAGGHMRVELAWVGTVMYELMHASGPGSAIYMDRLPAEGGFHLKHHHLGYMLDGEAQWQALMDEVAAKGHAMPHVSESEGFMKSCFVDAPELGHYLEYLLPTAAGRAFFDAVPGNGA